MLKYFIAVSEDLMVIAILIGLLYAWVERRFGKDGLKFLNVGAVVGFLAAAVMSYLKNTTSLIHTGIWNMRIFITSTVMLIVFFVFSVKKLRQKLPRVTEIIVCTAAALIAGLLIFYEMPDVFAYPYTIKQQGYESFFSTEYLFRFIGFVLGLIYALVAFFTARNVGLRVREKPAAMLTVAALSINAVQQICKTLSTMLSRRMISNKSPVYKPLFKLVKFTSNHSNLFIYLALAAVLLLAVVLWLESRKVTKPYDNPAQLRRLKAELRSNRRWAWVLLVVVVLMVLTLTWFTALTNRTVELSPAEDCLVQDGNVYVSLTQVEDGHLHRFSYVTPSGVETRFIVIKKPNSSAYGIGLDACDICGETGYYERDGQVVCKLCDVVMNINTIGFKGGCNPIPIEYKISEGYIIVPISTLVEHEKDFR